LNTKDKPLRGWLANPDRKERRDTANTFTDKDATQLITKINNYPEYISETLTKDSKDLEHQVKLRDKAMISLNWLFFKRAGEVLSLKRKDVQVTDRELLVTFQIQKKRKRYKTCPNCKTKNGYKSNFCRECNRNLQDIPVTYEGEPLIVTKRKTLKNKFTKYIAEWLEEFDRLTDLEEAWLFPPLQVVFASASFSFSNEKPMTVQNFDRILKRLDPRMTSCLFRYGGAEKYLVLGYTPFELKEIGDWSSTKMPEVYAKRKGITAAQRRWSEDTR
jgi:integrase